MNPCWAASLAPADSHLAAQLRLVPRVEVCAFDNRVWFRGDTLNEAIESRLRRLSGAWRFDVLGDGQLRAPGRRVPHGHLPAGPWQPLTEWLQLALPRATLPEARSARPLPSPVALRLVRSDEPRPATMLLTTMRSWAAYGHIAPQLRLDRCTFVLDGNGRCLIRASPLPPLAGIEIVEELGILVPAGWTWSPAVDAAVVREVLGLADGDAALLAESGSWELIAEREWVRATRSAIRLSQAGGTHGD